MRRFGPYGKPYGDILDIDPRQIPAGALMIWDDQRNRFVPARLTEGANVTITSEDGRVTIAATSELVPMAGTPDEPPTSPPAENDEFAASVLDAKWTATNTGSPSYDIHTTWPSRLIVTFTGNQLLSFLQPYAPSDFSITAKFHGALSASGQQFSIRAQTSSGTDRVYAVYENNSGTPRITLLTDDSSVFTVRASVNVDLASPVYLHLARATNTWSVWWSTDGFTFTRVGTHSKTMTVAKVGFEFNQNGATTPCQMGADWFRRDWTSL